MAFRIAATSDAYLPNAWQAAALWCLRVTYAIRCIGLGDAYLWNRWEHESDVVSLLIFDWQWPENTAVRAEDAGVALMVAFGITICLLPMVCPAAWRWPRWLTDVLLLCCLIGEVSLASAMVARGGFFLSRWTLATHALRIGVPLALVLWPHDRGQYPGIAAGVLRLATALTFIGHGVKAVWMSPVFVTLVIGAHERLTAAELSQASAETIVRAIGVIDIAVGTALLFWSSRWLALYLALWGFLTALSRVTDGIAIAYPETLLRLVHVGGPLALVLLWWPRTSSAATY